MNRLLPLLSLVLLSSPALGQTVEDSYLSYTLPDTAESIETESVVPLITGACYYWNIKLHKPKGAVPITETYSLPAEPTEWGVESNTTIADDNLSAVSTLSLEPVGGWISSGWCVGDGDPKGEYSFKIESGEAVLAYFDFELATPAPAPPPPKTKNR